VYIYIYIYIHLLKISVLIDVISELQIAVALDHAKRPDSHPVRAGYRVSIDYQEISYPSQ
jgi:hypothetical protein